MADVNRVLFARVGWMHFYKGVMPGDERLIGGGDWNKRHIGGEVFNFKEFAGHLYGYVEAKRSIALEKIDLLARDDDELDHVIVVFVAPRPGGGQVVVGWYSDARVLRHPVRWPGRAKGAAGKGVGSAGKLYYLKTKAKHAVLLPLANRTFEGVPVGKGGMGQANVCYRYYNAEGDEKDERWIEEALSYVINYDGPNLLRDPLADAERDVAEKGEAIVAGQQGQGFAQNAAQRRAIEGLAMSRAKRHFSRIYSKVEDVSAVQCYDLRCSAAGRPPLKVEVKGTTGAGDTVFLTKNEVALAKKGGCALFVLHSIKIAKNRATGGTPKVFKPWNVGRGRLEPMAYSYKVPKA